MEFDETALDSEEDIKFLKNEENSSSGINLLSNHNNSNQLPGIISEETKSSGAVKWETYAYYLQSCGTFWFGPMLILIMIWTAASWYLQNYFLGIWLTDIEVTAGNGDLSMM